MGADFYGSVDESGNIILTESANNGDYNIVTILPDNSIPGYSPKPDNLEAYVKDYLHVPLVYTGDFHYEVDSQLPDGVTNSRQYQILGYETYYKNIKVGSDGRLIKTEFPKTGEVDQETAIMNIYKAMGQEEYVYNLTDLKLDNSSQYIKNVKQATEQQLPMGSDQSDKIKYSAYRVAVTNSSPNVYNMKAYRDGLILSNYQSDGTPTDDWLGTVATLSDTITISDFCNLLYKIMDIYGEAVLTQKEQTLLVQTYGNSLPYYLDEDSLKAVKYLTAKGILNWEKEQYNFNDTLTKDVMLDILCAVKDTDSRYTFKDITLTLDSELVEKGYYETEVQATPSPILNIDNDDNKVAPSYYDYFVQAVDGVTTFTADNNDLLYKYTINVKGAKFLGVDESTGYYHFQIPKNKKSNITFKVGKYKFKIPNGGGYYDYDESTKSFTNRALESDAENLFDKAGQIRAQKAMEERAYLDESNQKAKIFVIIKSEADVANVKILGTALDMSKIRNKGQKIKNHKVTLSEEGKTGYVTICITNYSSRSELLGDLEVSSGYVSSYKAFCRDGNQLLVNVNYLLANNVITEPIEVEKNVLFMSTQYSDIYLDKKNGYIINGNMVSKLDSKDEVMFYKEDGEYYVDYRAVMGWSGEFLRFTDSKGKLSVGLSKRDFEVSRREVYTALGEPQKSVKVATVLGKVVLSSKYPLANYFIFKSDSAYYLFVFHNERGFSEHKASTKKLKEITGIELPKGVSVYMWRLTDDEEATKNLKGAWENPSGITYDKDYGFLYEPPSFTVFQTSKPNKNFKHGVNDDFNFPIQIVSDGTKFVDINLNLFTTESGDLDYGQVPESYFTNKTNKNIVTYKLESTSTSTSTGNSNSSSGNASGSSPTMQIKSVKAKTVTSYKTLKITPAVTGVVDTFYARKAWKTEDVRNTNHLLFYGTLPVYLKKKAIRLTSSSKSTEVMRTSEVKDGFRLLRATTHNSYIFSVIWDNQLEPVTVSSKKDNTSGSSLDQIGTEIGNTLSGFDWNSFNFKNSIERFDTITQIILIIALAIIPRIAMFFFFTLIALSLITNVKLFQLMCARFIDPIKVLTFGRQDVHTVNTFRMLISSILALGLFGLFMDGTIINVLGFIQAVFIRLLQL